ncbi:hypothetical protein CYMTET_20435, partial [Cymbomonas tetramitiformis]
TSDTTGEILMLTQASIASPVSPSSPTSYPTFSLTPLPFSPTSHPTFSLTPLPSSPTSYPTSSLSGRSTAAPSSESFATAAPFNPPTASLTAVPTISPSATLTPVPIAPPPPTCPLQPNGSTLVPTFRNSPLPPSIVTGAPTMQESSSESSGVRAHLPLGAGIWKLFAAILFVLAMMHDAICFSAE